MNDPKTGSNDWAASSARNTVRLRYWVIAWVATTAVAAGGPKFIWDFATVPTILGVLMNLGVGFGMILANKRHLNGLDELQQKIQLESMALSLGVGLICGISYSVMDTTRLISFDAEISHLVIFMGLTYLAGIFAGQRRYR